MPDSPIDYNDDQRQRRLELFCGYEQMRRQIEATPGNSGMKQEAVNLLTVALRLALRLSDGAVSPFEVRAW
jgi:hypothetical protein